MQELKEKYILYTVLLISCVFSFSLLFYPGAYDVNYWMKWMDNISRLGLVKGYVANNDMYPPFTSVFFYILVKFSPLFQISHFTALKLSLFLSLISTTVIILFWTKNLLVAISTQLIFTLISTSLAYVDIVTAPFILLSLYALHKKKYMLFVLFYFVNIMIKWQGLIMAPFIFVYFLNISSFKEIKKIEWKIILYKIAIPSVVLLIMTFLVFGYEVHFTFYRALNNNFLSDTINFNWIVTAGLYIIKHHSIGVNNSMIDPMMVQPGKIYYTLTFVFWSLYLLTLLSFFKDEKNLLNLLKYTVIGYLAYFLFNIGIHENHLFIAALLSMIIVAFDPKYLGVTIGLNLILNICLFFWFEVDGNQEYIYGKFATVISVVLASLFTVLFVFVYIPVVRNLKENLLTGKKNIPLQKSE